jgi:hypothetical protein
MDFLDLMKRHWFLAGTMIAIFFAEIFPELGAKEGKINLLFYCLSQSGQTARDIRGNLGVSIAHLSEYIHG